MDYKETYEKILGEYRQVFERVDQDNMRAFIDEVKAHDRIFLIGVGREGMATRAFAMRLMHMGKEIHWIWDDTTPSIGEGDLLIATLGDGRIGHINYICERAKEAGAMIYVVVEELIPESQTNQKKDLMAFFTLFGFVLMMILDITLG